LTESEHAKIHQQVPAFSRGLVRLPPRCSDPACKFFVQGNTGIEVETGLIPFDAGPEPTRRHPRQ
jgi:hypothetical protein